MHIKASSDTSLGADSASAMGIIRSWPEELRQSWGQKPLRLEHRLHKAELFSEANLAALIDHYPRQHYALVEMGAQGQRRLWREGDLGGVRGKAVIEAIAQGRMWLNLRNVKTVDSRYNQLLEEIFAEMAVNIPNFSSFNHGMGILISSPNAQVYYHADLPGQSLWQIAGKKRVYVYPAQSPYIRPEDLESIALYGVEVDMIYDPAYDKEAVVFDLEPGQMLHWPLNAPHRVENANCLNISMTLEYWSEEIRRKHMVNVGNGLLRHQFGIVPKSRSIEGASFWSKAVLQKALKNSSYIKKKQADLRPLTFRLDPDHAGQLIDLT